MSQAVFSEAVMAYQRGEHARARRVCEQVLNREPGHFEALHLLGVVAAQEGRMTEAADCFRRALALNARHPALQAQLGAALHKLGRNGEALECLERALALKPDAAPAHDSRGNILTDLGRYEAAISSYQRAIALAPDFADAHNDLGVALGKVKQHEEAVASFDHALLLEPDFADAHNNRGVALTAVKRFEDAVASFDRALALEPGMADAWKGKGIALAALLRHSDALLAFRHALDLDSSDAGSHNAMGLSLYAFKRFDEALACFDRALKLKGDFADAHCHRGLALAAMKRLNAAIVCYERALLLNPDCPTTLTNLGAALADSFRMDDAIACYEKALALQPDFPQAGFSLSLALLARKRYVAALEVMQKTLTAKPDYEFLPGIYLQAKLQICDWNSYEYWVGRIESAIKSDIKACSPFITHLLPFAPEIQKRSSVHWVKAETLGDRRAVIAPTYGRHPKIRVGYFSPDFRDHPVTYLTAELFERHDRSRFEITAFSFAPPRYEQSERVARAFDRFVDACALSDRECVDLARSLELDIAVDLAGYTEHSRSNVFALRAAPLQLHYIGFLGTMGADFIDYMIADRELIYPQEESHYTEKIIYLPSYQVNDTKRVSSGNSFSRMQWGLPEAGFVYCCFNACKKINPRMFDKWMRILHQVPGSVLWLLEDNLDQVANLRREAANRGIDAGRLVFAGFVSLSDYLARFAVADLFLDTLPYNAGATGSDALWAGLPLLTCRGDTFAGRYGASMLRALNLPELIAGTMDEYEARAVALARDAQQLAGVREKLAHGRMHGRLFDIARFTDSIESAYNAIYERHQQGLPPATIVV